ncbi:hypothetical protein PFLUV_G00204990 [Perca fluviatilis]|uniref:Uncharacterized protein n=1 Tax=Perca fluviatilis TaxID=8168 RepID=A0A6A5DU86_PERFL|nr:hypothetical protein PFLUV_G00204990 [Perca fluviatilis]
MKLSSPKFPPNGAVDPFAFPALPTGSINLSQKHRLIAASAPRSETLTGLRAKREYDNEFPFCDTHDIL